MKRLVALLLLAAAAGSAVAQPGVGVSIGINQPGVYGRINIGDLPPPALVAAQPVLIAPPRVRVERRPIYLYVSPVEQQNWGRYCGRYAACEQPVYFVRDEWVRERYSHDHPGWDRRHGRDWHDGRGHDRGDDRRGDRHDRHD